MQRHEWQFKFTAKQLAEASAKKKAHHEGRLKFWEQAKEKVMADVRESGIEVSESEAGGSYSNAVRGPQVMVRNDLQKRLSECHTKIVEHRSKVAEFSGWIEVLEANPNDHLSLHADDYLFFFSVG